MNQWSFDDRDGKNEIPIGTSVCMGDSYPWGAGAKIVRKASIKEIRAEGYGVRPRFDRIREQQGSHIG